MLISLNKIKSYLPEITTSTDDLIKLIGSRLVEVEGHTDLAPKYQGIKVVKVLSAEPIEGTHLHLCRIQTGGTNDSSDGHKLGRTALSVPAEDHSRQDSPVVQVVCGAPNVHAGMLTAWIMPGSIVPSTYGNENFKLSVRKLRGYDSHGMLAAVDELDLGTDHEGIIEIDPKDAKPGDDFATVFDLNDIILDIENKSLTHRPDCFGLIGFAREVAGILGLPFESQTGIFADVMRFRPDLRMSKLQHSAGSCDLDDEQVPSAKIPVKIQITDTTLCPRYSCAVLDCTKLLEKGKYFTKTDAFLGKLGMRGISPIVDLTNILMLETGQPLHAFDYDKFVKVGGAKNPKITVRLAKEGEKLQLLDGKTIDCVPTDILITSNDIPVALAGAMGGASTEIDASSTKIILESATFSLYNLRKTQMAHGIFSEAITRFTKGQPASQTMPVLQEAIRRLGTEPIAIADCYPNPAKPIVVKITTNEINNLLGTNYDAATIEKTLANVGFGIEREAGGTQCSSGGHKLGRTALSVPTEEHACQDPLLVTAPAWRTDIHIKEDLIEEVGRLLGYDNITPTLPTRTFSTTKQNPTWKLKSELRSILSDKLAAHELLTYSFISGDLLDKVGEPREKSYKIVNSISPELQYFRQSITPSLLDKVYQNLKDGHKDFTIYEINQVVDKSEKLDVDHVPVSRLHLSVLTFGDFYQIKSIAEALNRHLKITNPYGQAEQPAPYFEPTHSATDELGAWGEIKKSVLRKFKLDAYQISALEWDITPILAMPKTPLTVDSLAFAKFPSVSRDITVKTDLTFGEISTTLHASLSEQGLIYAVTPVSIYQPEAEEATRNLSFHLDFANPAKTLTSEEISAIIEKVSAHLVELGAQIL